MESKHELVRKWTAGIKNEYVDSPQNNYLKDFIKMTVKGYQNGLLVKGKPGLGKSFTVVRMVKEVTDDFFMQIGYSTPLALYKVLYENRNRGIIFDDTEGLLRDKKAVAVLKNALFSTGETRLVSWESTSKALEDTPPMFEFTGWIIIICNEIDAAKDMNLEAILSRVINFEVTYTHNEILEMSHKILEQRKDLTQYQRDKALDIINRNITEVSGFNYRMLDRVISFIKYNDSRAEELFLSSFEVDDKLELVSRLEANDTLTNAKRYEMFKEQTGLGDRTYKRVKAQLKKLRGEKNGCS